MERFSVVFLLALASLAASSPVEINVPSPNVEIGEVGTANDDYPVHPMHSCSLIGPASKKRLLKIEFKKVQGVMVFLEDGRVGIDSNAADCDPRKRECPVHVHMSTCADVLEG